MYGSVRFRHIFSQGINWIFFNICAKFCRIIHLVIFTGCGGHTRWILKYIKMCRILKSIFVIKESNKHRFNRIRKRQKIGRVLAINLLHLNLSKTKRCPEKVQKTSFCLLFGSSDRVQEYQQEDSAGKHWERDVRRFGGTPGCRL